MKTPLISVIIPTFNRGELLGRAIDSVVKQTFRDFDLWIIDDGSTDHTSNIIQPYLANNNVYYLKTKNQGVSAARNIGIEKSSGEWLAFLDSDDRWLFDKLERQVEFIKNHPSIPLVHGEEIWIRNGKRVNPKNIHKKFGGMIFEKCLPLCLISPSAALIRRDILNEMQGFDENYIVCEDYDLWLKITSKYEVGFIEKAIIEKYGGHDDQLSSKYFAMDYWRIKSLDRILAIRSLNAIQTKLVKDEIIKKGNILLLGYEKHRNMNDYEEVKKIVEKNS